MIGFLRVCSGQVFSRFVSCLEEERSSIGIIDPGRYGLFADDAGRLLLVLGRAADAESNGTVLMSTAAANRSFRIDSDESSACFGLEFSSFDERRGGFEQFAAVMASFSRELID